MKPDKPDKPEDRAESWLRKMSERIPGRRSRDDIKVEAVEIGEPEDEQELAAQSDSGAVAARSKKKKRKNNTDPVWFNLLVVVFRWIMLCLAFYGLWRIIS